MQQSAISNQQSVWGMFWGFLSGRTAMAGIVALFIIVFGVGSVFATEGLLPSSPLYRLKLAIESAKGTLALTAEQKALYGAAVAQKRVQELTKLSQGPSTPRADGKQAALIAETVKRYSDALSASSRSLKQLQAEGRTQVVRQTAEKLDEAARAYTVLLSSLDSTTSVKEFNTATSSADILENAKTLSFEAQETAGEILRSPEDAYHLSTSMSTPYVSATSVGSTESGADVTVPLPSPADESSPKPAPANTAYPTILPNVVE